MMDSKAVIAIAILFMIVAVFIKTAAPKQNTIELDKISVPVFADEYVIKTTVVHGETATIYYTSYSPYNGTYATYTILPSATITHQTAFWKSNGTWYYVSAAILSSTNTFPHPGLLTVQMVITNNVLVVYSNGTAYTPTGSLESTISVFTIVHTNTTIEYTILHGSYAKIKR